MNKLLARLFFCAVLLAFAPVAYAIDWQTWAPTGERFHAELPAGYQTSDSALNEGAPKDYFNTWAIVEGRSYYEVSYTVLPSAAINADADFSKKMLDGGINNLLQGQAGTSLRTDKRFTFNGYQAAEWIVDGMPLEGLDKAGGAAAKGVFHGISVLRQDRLFQMIYIGPTGSDTEPDAQKFLQSLVVE